MKLDIKNRFTGKVQFTAEIECDVDALLGIKFGLAVKWAIKTGAYLARANLADANLAGADLADANLAGANLAGADLADANLAGAYLARADLADANLAGADLARANLADANLAGADLADANLAGANLARADLAGADLADANLAGANLDRADLAGAYLAGAVSWRANLEPFDVPLVPKIDAVILAEIEKGGLLDMGVWHGPQGWCGTTHCRAGWAVHCAGKQGRALEEKVGTQRAAAMIYRASRPGQHAPWFFAPTDVALADIRKCAAEQEGKTE
jgi:Pentapeptide repeats (8 copies)